MNELVRLNKFIASCGYASRRKADELIKTGKVIINGKVINEPGTMVDVDNDFVKVENKVLKLQKSNLYYVLNKPLGFITSNYDPHHKNLARNLLHYNGHLFNVGRLDSDTSGLLIYTNDGDFSNIMTHPSYEIKKKYEVVLDAYLSDDIASEIESGVKLDDGVTNPAKIDIKKRNKHETRLTIIISEGKNRQIRRMFEHYDFSVKELKRLSHGMINLEDIEVGKYREFTKKELDYVKFLKDKYL